MYRQYDWTCLSCRVVFTTLVSVPQGEQAPASVTWAELEQERCGYCGGTEGAERCQVNQVAHYLGDRPFSPMVKGGNFDTAGHKPLPPMPEFKGETGRDFQDFRHTKDFKDAKAERKARAGENKVKRERAKLIKQGANIDIRHHPLPGDPNVMA